MAEYIERQALLAEYDRVHVGPPGGARKLIEEAPSADVVPVVRCKDCLYWQSGENECDKWEYCTIHNIGIGPHSFCSYGERKEADGNG